jgi:hypothetical protein
MGAYDDGGGSLVLSLASIIRLPWKSVANNLSAFLTMTLSNVLHIEHESCPLTQAKNDAKWGNSDSRALPPYTFYVNPRTCEHCRSL